MSSAMKNILIIGGTGGIGEAFAHRFHSMGKELVVTGRRKEKLSELELKLPGIATYAMDNAELAALPGHVDTIMAKYPAIDTVWVNSGIQYAASFKDDKPDSSNKDIIQEINVNITAPTILARHFIPHLLAKKSETNFMITSSGLAYVPMGLYPVYCPTKAYVHSFMVTLRQQMQGTNVNIIELVPPYVATELDSAHADVSPIKPMPLADFTNEAFQIMDEADAKTVKEIAPGSAKGRVEAWRGSMGAILEQMKVGG